MPVICWHLIPKALSLAFSRLGPEPPVRVAVLCFHTSPATASHGSGGAWVSAVLAVSPGARAPPDRPPRVSSLQPAQWHRALPSQSEASVRPAVCSRWTARERKRKRIGPACSDGFLRFLFHLWPPPSFFVCPHGPQTSEQSQQAVNTDQHRSPPPPETQPLKYFPEHPGVEMGRGLLSREAASCMSIHVIAPPTGPRLGLSAGSFPAREKLPSELTLVTRPHPAGTSSLPAPVWAPASPGPLDHRFLCGDSGCRLLEEPCFPGHRASRGLFPSTFDRCAFRPLSPLSRHSPSRPRGACS